MNFYTIRKSLPLYHMLYKGQSDPRVRFMTKLFFKALDQLMRKRKTGICFVILSFLLWIKKERDRKIQIICKKTRLNDILCEAIKPAIKKYSPTFWIPSSFLKMAVLPDKLHVNYEYFTRWKVELEDGEKVAVDIFPKNHKNLNPETPTILLLPGIYSDSNKAYCVKFCEQVRSTLGWRVCVINRRGFGGMPWTKYKLVSYVLYDDIHHIINLTAEKFPVSKLYMVGISMGAMNLQRYLGEYGKEPKLQAAVAISSPWNSMSSVKKMEKNYFVKKVMMEQFFIRIKNHMHDEHFLKIAAEKKIDLGKIFFD